ncbi:predicted protein [Postia placenta Mad-698-R]|nr:predicted protein [Postia placenta Mad-698-R]
MRTFQVLLLFLSTLAATVLADSYAREERMVARDVWDNDALFARDEDALYAHDDELYARDLEEYKDHPLVREIVNVLWPERGATGSRRATTVVYISPWNSEKRAWILREDEEPPG